MNRDDMRSPPARCHSSSSIANGNLTVQNDEDNAIILAQKYFPFNNSPLLCDSTHTAATINRDRRKEKTHSIFSFLQRFRAKNISHDSGRPQNVTSLPSSPRSVRYTTIGRHPEHRWESVESVLSSATAASFAFIPSLQPHRPVAASCIPQQPQPQPTASVAVRIDNTAYLRRKYNLLGSDATLCSRSNVYLDERRSSNTKKLQRNSVNDVENLKAIWGSDDDISIANWHRPKSYEYANTYRRRVHCHRPGKRRAPQPPPVRDLTPIPQDLPVRIRKKRKAPSPPISRIPFMEDSRKTVPHDYGGSCNATLSEPEMYNDSLKLERGQLKANKLTSSTTAMAALAASSSLSKATTTDVTDGSIVVPVSPKPWYKRSATRPTKNAKSLEKKKSGEQLMDEWMLEAGLPRSSTIYKRQIVACCALDENAAQAAKRKSQISMLANISELDREAAQIVQKEREREMERANTADNKFYSQSPPTPADKFNGDVDTNTSRRHVSKDLISILNAISNVTKLTVNASFFKDGTTITSQQEAETSEQREQKKPPNRLTITELDDFDKEHTGAVGVDAKKLSVKAIATSSPPKLIPAQRTVAESLKTPKPPFSSWMCPQCTLENPSWKFICEACNLWRPYTVTKLRTAKALITPKEDTKLSPSNDVSLEFVATAKKASTDARRRAITSRYVKAAATIDEEKRTGKTTTTQTDSKTELIEEVRKARLAFFEKYVLNGGGVNFDENETDLKSSSLYDKNVRANCHREEMAILKELVLQSTKEDRVVDDRVTSTEMKITNTESRDRYMSKIEKDNITPSLTLETSSSSPMSTNRHKDSTNLSPKPLMDRQKSITNIGTNTKEIKHVSTLAVNRLLKKLQTAIANGHHHEAANIAKELARLRVRCRMIRQESPEYVTQPTEDLPAVTDLHNSGVRANDDRFDRATIDTKIRAKIQKEYKNLEIVNLTFDKKTLGDGLTIECVDVNGKNDALFACTEPKTMTKINNSNPSFTSNLSSKKPKFKKQSNIDDFASILATSSNELITTRVENSNSPIAADHSVTVKPDLHVREKINNGIPSSIDTRDTKETSLIDNNRVEQVAEPLNSKTEIQTNKPSEWICLVCTLINEISEVNCVACSRHRPLKYDDNEAKSMSTRIEQVDPSPEKKMSNYLELVDLEKTDLIANVERFNCFICLTSYEIGEGVTLKNCLHTFCRECLSQTIEHSIEAEIKCPYRDADYSCESTLQEREIKALVKPHIFEKHLARSVSEAENKIKNAFHCKTANCPGWCIFEDNVNEFHCPVCSKLNCLTCQVIHTGLNCKQYQEVINKESETNADANRTRLMLQEMLQRGEAMTCPTCQVILMKKWGCDWLRCTMCKTEICWVTKGPRWGLKGKGDISGGCRCGVNGVKCHQRCTFCH